MKRRLADWAKLKVGASRLTQGVALKPFTLGDVLHTVRGSFKLKRGSVRFDPDTGQAGGEIVVDVTSGNTNGDARDRRMDKAILESARYPMPSSSRTISPDRFPRPENRGSQSTACFNFTARPTR